MDGPSLLAVFAGIACGALAAFFLVYGIKAGIIERSILASSFGRRDTGRAAVVRGFWYTMIGLFFLASSILIFVTLFARHSAS